MTTFDRRYAAQSCQSEKTNAVAEWQDRLLESTLATPVCNRRQALNPLDKILPGY
ncbi:hypothetical protein [Mesorhizobium sp.]|nr:hypothetical protein [Mesorhizobium sp.]